MCQGSIRNTKINNNRLHYLKNGDVVVLKKDLKYPEVNRDFP